MREHGIDPRVIQNISKREENDKPTWDSRLTEDQITEALGRGIDEPKGQEYEQFLREHGIDPDKKSQTSNPNPIPQNDKYYLATSTLIGNNFHKLIYSKENNIDVKDIIDSINYETICKMFLGKEYKGQKVNITTKNIRDFYDEILPTLEEFDKDIANKVISKMMDITQNRVPTNEDINVVYIPEQKRKENSRYFDDKGYINYKQVNKDLKEANIDPKNTTLDELKNRFLKTDGTPDEQKAGLLNDIINSQNYKEHQRKAKKCFLKSNAFLAGVGFVTGFGFSMVKPKSGVIVGGILFGNSIVKLINKSEKGHKIVGKLVDENGKTIVDKGLEKGKNLIAKTVVKGTDHLFGKSKTYQGIKSYVSEALQNPWFRRGFTAGTLTGGIVKLTNLDDKINLFKDNDVPDVSDSNIDTTDLNQDEIGESINKQPSLSEFDKNNGLDDIPEIMSTVQEENDLAFLENYRTGQPIILDTLQEGARNVKDAITDSGTDGSLNHDVFSNTPSIIERVLLPNNQELTGSISEMIEETKSAGYEIKDMGFDIYNTDGKPRTWTDGEKLVEALKAIEENASKAVHTGRKI